jgi:hypothetical protein
MLRMKRNGSLCLTVVAAALSILCSGCGSSSNNSSMPNNSMSQAQAQAVSAEISQAMAQALGGAIPSSAPAASGTQPSLAAAVRDIRPDTSGSGCTSTATGQNCNLPISLIDYPCNGTQGGTISVTGDIDGTLSDAGAGSVNGQFTITPANCSVSNLIINGDPSITVAGQINFTANENPVFPITFTETGGISYGPNPSGSCQVNATYTINSSNSSLSCTVSGTVCGQSVSGSC